LYSEIQDSLQDPVPREKWKERYHIENVVKPAGKENGGETAIVAERMRNRGIAPPSRNIVAYAWNTAWVAKLSEQTQRGLGQEVVMRFLVVL
jgi:hypothetical protein